MARSPDPFEDDDDGGDEFVGKGDELGDDEDGEFGGVDIDAEFGRAGDDDDDDGDPFADDDDGDPFAADDDDPFGDDDFDDFDLDSLGPADDDDDDDEGGLSGPLIGLIAASLVLIVLIASVVGWLMISYDPGETEEAQNSKQVITTLAPPPKAKPKPKPIPKPVIVAKPPEQATAAEGTATADQASADPAADPAGKPPAKAGETSEPEESAGDGEQQAAADGAKPTSAVPVIKKTIEEEKVAVAAVDPLLIDETTTGPLPKIAPDGRQAWQVYARPFTAPDKKVTKIAVIMAGLGLSETQTLAAIQQLPGAVTLSFAPYARNLGDWIAQSRAAGHEVLLELPMEPFDYPDNDPGPHTLLTSLSTPDNIERLNWLLGRFPGYVGVTNFMGAKFTANEQKLVPILQNLKDRGLLYLDAKVDRKSVAARVAKELKVPIATNNRFIDREASRVSIDARLYELERISKSVGSAVGLAFPYPVTVERLAAWIATLEKKGFVLAPVTAIANSQPIR